jgi:hypothetical protein
MAAFRINRKTIQTDRDSSVSHTARDSYKWLPALGDQDPQGEEIDMAAKEVITGKQSRLAILHGVSVLANAVKVTLGPKGRNVVIEKKFGSPLITKDGVTVANSRAQGSTRERWRCDGTNINTTSNSFKTRSVWDAIVQ